MRKRIVLTLVALSLGLAACGPSSNPTAVPSAAALSGTIRVAGSTTLQPLAEELAEAFTAANPGVKIEGQGGGSSVGIKSAGQDTVDIGTASRRSKTRNRPSSRISRSTPSPLTASPSSPTPKSTSAI